MNTNKPELTHRERVRLALAHQQTDRVPIAMVCSGINEPARTHLDQLLRSQRNTTLDAYLEPLLDIRYVEPAYIGPPLPAGTDIWGVRRRSMSFGAGAYDEIEHYPLANAEHAGDLDAHRWPSPDWFDYDALREQIRRLRRQGDYCLMAHNGNPFESSWYMRGLEQAMMDMALDPDLLHGILERVTNFFSAYFKRVLEAADGEIDLVFTADDIGGQESLLFSLRMWETQIKPWHRRLNQTIHDYGAKVIYHSDGTVTDAVPGLIDMGIDVLQALQFDAKNMDAAFLKNNFGDRLCFQGGVSVQSTLPFGTPAQVQAEVKERIRVLGRDGGYILGPSHWIQAGTPPENIVAMFDAAAQGE